MLYPDKIDLAGLARRRVFNDQAVFLCSHQNVISAPEVHFFCQPRNSQHFNLFRYRINNVYAALPFEFRAEEKELARVLDKACFRKCITETIESSELLIIRRVVSDLVYDNLWWRMLLLRPAKHLQLIVAGMAEKFRFAAKVGQFREVLGEARLHRQVLPFQVDLTQVAASILGKLLLVKNGLLDMI